MKIPASAACLNTCYYQPDHPVGSLPITSDRTVNQPQFTTDITRGPADQHHRRKSAAPRTLLAPADYKCMPARYRLATTCDKLPVMGTS